MTIIRNLKKDFSARWNLLKNSGAMAEQRIFAGLELFCFPASFLTLFVLLPFQIIAARTGFELSSAAHCTLNVLLSAAIGYITNYIAIEMLFKPYHKEKLHPLSILSLGYWQQGLVPKNKNKIGAELGRQIETKLLNPEKMADELCGMVMEFVQNPEIIGNLRNTVQNLIRSNEKSIMAFLIPQIERSLAKAVDSIMTKERLEMFWHESIEPFLTAGENRALIANHIIASLQRRTPETVDILKRELQTISYDFLSRKLPFGFGADALAEGLVAFVDWNNIGQRLRYKLGEESTAKLISEELLNCFVKLSDWLKSPEAAQKIGAFATLLKTKITVFLHDYLQETLPAMASETMQSDQLWQWVENDLLPSLKPKLENLIREVGKEKVISKLNLASRVSEAVEKQDVKEFHDMINSIAAQHLGAIQVLGYILGGIVGLAQLFI